MFFASFTVSGCVAWMFTVLLAPLSQSRPAARGVRTRPAIDQYLTSVWPVCSVRTRPAREGTEGGRASCSRGKGLKRGSKSRVASSARTLRKRVSTSATAFSWFRRARACLARVRGFRGGRGRGRGRGILASPFACLRPVRADSWPVCSQAYLPEIHCELVCAPACPPSLLAGMLASTLADSWPVCSPSVITDLIIL
jgi:hypothetical protein